MTPRRCASASDVGRNRRDRQRIRVREVERDLVQKRSVDLVIDVSAPRVQEILERIVDSAQERFPKRIGEQTVGTDRLARRERGPRGDLWDDHVERLFCASGSRQSTCPSRTLRKRSFLNCAFSERIVAGILGFPEERTRERLFFGQVLEQITKVPLFSSQTELDTPVEGIFDFRCAKSWRRRRSCLNVE